MVPNPHGQKEIGVLQLRAFRANSDGHCWAGASRVRRCSWAGFLRPVSGVLECRVGFAAVLWGGVLWGACLRVGRSRCNVAVPNVVVPNVSVPNVCWCRRALAFCDREAGAVDVWSLGVAPPPADSGSVVTGGRSGRGARSESGCPV